MKDFTAWLGSTPGRKARLAQHCSVTKAAVSQWLKHGVPVRHYPAVLAFAAGELSIKVLAEHAVKRCGTRPAKKAHEAAEAH